MAGRDNREAILVAALALSSEKGLDAVSTAEVCRAAGVSNGTMFHFFPTKDALAAALYLRALESYQGAIVAGLERARSARAGVRSLVLEHLRWILAHPEQARFLHEERGDAGPTLQREIAARNEVFFNRVSEWLRPHVARGTLRKVPVDVLVALVFGPIQTITRTWLRGGDAARLRAVAPMLADAAWAALARKA